MLLSRSATVFTLALIVLAFPRIEFTAAQETEAERNAKSQTVQDGPPASCHVTLPSAGSAVPSSPVRATEVGIWADGMVSAYGTEKLSTLLPTDGIWRGAMPSKPGDFAYDNKLPWRGAFSYRDGPLKVTGKRLDGLAPSFTEIEPISGKHWFMGGMSIPVFGCWQITAHYKDQELTFIVWVTPLPQEESSSGVLLPQTAIAPASNNAITIEQEPLVSDTQLRRVHVDGDVQAKLLRYRLTPEIPREAQVANVSDTVVLHAIIDRDGRTRELQYVSGPSQLAQAAIDAVKWWDYEVNGEDVEIDTTIEVEFSPADS